MHRPGSKTARQEGRGLSDVPAFVRRITGTRTADALEAPRLQKARPQDGRERNCRVQFLSRQGGAAFSLGSRARSCLLLGRGTESPAEAACALQEGESLAELTDEIVDRLRRTVGVRHREGHIQAQVDDRQLESALI